MHSSLIAVVLCILAQGSAACITTADDTHSKGPDRSRPMSTKVQAAGAAPARRRTDHDRRRRHA